MTKFITYITSVSSVTTSSGNMPFIEKTAFCKRFRYLSLLVIADGNILSALFDRMDITVN